MIIGNDLAKPGTGATSGPQQSNNPTSPAASDFQSFLTLLTAQLRNQDPLSPLDSTQFVEQLASFSAVEQQIEANGRLEQIANAVGNAGLQSASQWVGKDVEANVNRATFDGGTLEFRFAKDVNSATRQLRISDERGHVVHTRSLGPSATSFIWDGTVEDGSTAPSGTYTAEIKATDEDGDVTSQSLSTISGVVEARLIDGSVKLLLDSGTLIDPESVTALISRS